MCVCLCLYACYLLRVISNAFSISYSFSYQRLCILYYHFWDAGNVYDMYVCVHTSVYMYVCTSFVLCTFTV